MLSQSDQLDFIVTRCVIESIRFDADGCMHITR